jgi:hypothetical protein
VIQPAFTYQRLPRPSYLFANDQRFASALSGLRVAGPYSVGDCPKEPRILFVFPDELRDKANQLFLALKNGVGPFRGTESLLRVQLSAGAVKRLQPFSVQNMPHDHAATAYRSAIEKYLATNHLDIDLALVIHKKTERTDQTGNPYLTSKFPLLVRNIPTQVVTEELLERAETFQWSVANIALAMFAKMGGQPWAVESGLSDDTLVVGINRATVGQSRLYAFASIFAHNGTYLGTTLSKPANDRATYLQALRSTVTDSLTEWRDRFGTPVNLVLHMRKEASKEELEVIETCIRSVSTDIVRAHVALRLAPGDYMAIIDPQNETGTPPLGTYIQLGSHRAMLQISGQDPDGSAFGRIVNSGPWHINRLYESANAPPLDVLCTHILALSAMNWASLNAEASPVTIKYPAELAELLGRFAEAGFDLGELRDLSVLRRVWFI